MRIFLFFVLIAAGFSAATSTQKKIDHSVVSLDKSVKKQRKVSGHLEEIAKDIEQAKRENNAINKKLQNLSEEYRLSTKEYEDSKKTLAEYDNNLESINKKLEEKKELFIRTLASQSSIIYAMNQAQETTRESIVLEEAYRLLKAHNSRDLYLLKKQIDRKIELKRKINTKRAVVKSKIDKISMQRLEYKKEREAKSRTLQKLERDEEQYQTKLQKTMDEQGELRSTLAKLNILKAQEVEEEQRLIAAQKAAIRVEEKRKKDERMKRKLVREVARKEGKKIVYDTENDEISKPVKVNYSGGSTYSRQSTKAYHGGKTISPISGARVIKGFGSYVDPIYKIKVFNQSVTLQAQESDALVKNVLNGKVVFAGSSSMLGNVVVVSHGDQMHTVYAGLSQIAPTISKGQLIRKGYVVGKVASKLIFEATKDSQHINPMSLIRL